MTSTRESQDAPFVQRQLLAELEKHRASIPGVAMLMSDVARGVYLSNTSACADAMLAVRLDQLGLKEMAKRAATNYYTQCEPEYQAELNSAIQEARVLLRNKPPRAISIPQPPAVGAATSASTTDVAATVVPEFDWLSAQGQALLERMVSTQQYESFARGYDGDHDPSGEHDVDEQHRLRASRGNRITGSLAAMAAATSDGGDSGGGMRQV